MVPIDPLIERLRRLKRREIAFDIGAGTGYFTFHLAKLFKVVYAVEKDFEKAKKISEKGVKNVGVIVTDKPPEVDFDVDFVLFANSLHEIEDKGSYAEWVKRSSRTFAVIEWKRDACVNMGPPREVRIDPDYVIDLFDGKTEVVDIHECFYMVFGYVLR